MCWVCIIDSVYLHYGAKQLYQCVLIWYEPWSMPVCKYLVAMQPRMMQTSFNVNFNLPLYLLDWVISERPESDFTKVAAYTTSPITSVSVFIVGLAMSGIWSSVGYILTPGLLDTNLSSFCHLLLNDSSYVM